MYPTEMERDHGRWKHSTRQHYPKPITGCDVATEFISGVGHVQLMKIDVGDANTSTIVSTPTRFL